MTENNKVAASDKHGKLCSTSDGTPSIPGARPGLKRFKPFVASSAETGAIVVLCVGCFRSQEIQSSASSFSRSVHTASCTSPWLSQCLSWSSSGQVISPDCCVVNVLNVFQSCRGRFLRNLSHKTSHSTQKPALIARAVFLHLLAAVFHRCLASRTSSEFVAWRVASMYKVRARSAVRRSSLKYSEEQHFGPSSARWQPVKFRLLINLNFLNESCKLDVIYLLHGLVNYNLSFVAVMDG